jgi:hypothetical protein
VARYPDCSTALAALARGDPELCHDFVGLREAVMCKVWHESPPVGAPSFGDAVRAAWDDARRRCAPAGGITPESGFVEAVEAHHPEAAPRVREAFEVTDSSGRRSVVVEMDDGSAYTCGAGRCAEYPSVGAALASIPGAVRP